MGFQTKGCPLYLANLIIWFCVVATPLSAADLPEPLGIYLKHFEAIGGYEKVKAEKSGYLEGHITYDGLEGTVRQWEQIPLRLRVEQDFRVIQQMYGDTGQVSWSVDTNGKRIIQRDEETLKRRKVKALLQVYDHMNPDTPNFILHFQGIQKVGPIDCYVVKMTNRINQDIFLDYFRTDTFFLEKSVVIQPDLEFHTRYSDFREVNGVWHAFREETDIRPREKKITVQLHRYQTNLAIAPSRFELPEDGVEDFQFIEGDRAEEIPFELIENNIFLPVRVGSDERWWLLDNGATMTVIDADYAQNLGLTQKGGIKGSGFKNTFDLSFVTLPPYSLPGIRFEAQKVFAFQGLADRFYEPQIAGVMGFDLLSRFVTRIDYAKRRIAFYEPKGFRYQGPGVVVEAPLKDKVFSLPMRVEDRYKGRWSLDLGAYNMSFHFPYAQTHGLFQRDGIERVSADLGGYYFERRVRFEHLELAGFTVADPLINVPAEKGKGANTARELIGNIGNDLLRRFVVYLDYHRQQVIFEKGRDFERRFPRDKSGLIIGQAEDNGPMISFVAPDTPGERAGFLAGDLIRRVNTEPVDHRYNVVGLRQLLRQAAGTVIQIGVQRQEQQLEIQLTLEDLF